MGCVQMLNQQTQNICTTSAQRLRRWSNIVQMLYKCFVSNAQVITILEIFELRYSSFKWMNK